MNKENNNKKICNKCGTILNKNHIYCYKCGTKYKEELPNNSKTKKSKSTEIFDFTYKNEKEFKILERSLKKYNMMAYKKLLFDYYPRLKKGELLGELISINRFDNSESYELQLPTDNLFIKVYGKVKLSYTVFKEENTIMLIGLEPKDILMDGHKSELTAYKGIMISKKNAYKEMFKIDLLSRLEDK